MFNQFRLCYHCTLDTLFLVYVRKGRYAVGFVVE